MLPSTAVKSNGKLSAPSTRSLYGGGVCCCCCTLRVCARPPRTLLASTGALRWMKSSSKQERTADSPSEFLATPRLCISNYYWRTFLACLRGLWRKHSISYEWVDRREVLRKRMESSSKRSPIPAVLGKNSLMGLHGALRDGYLDSKSCKMRVQFQFISLNRVQFVQ